MTYAYKKRCPVLTAVTVDELGAISVYPNGDEIGLSRAMLAEMADALIHAGFKAREIKESRDLRRRPDANAHHERQAEI